MVDPLVDPEAEEKLLAAVLENPALADGSDFHPGLFASCPQSWAGAIKALRAAGDPVSAHSVSVETGSPDAQTEIEGLQARYAGSSGPYCLKVLADLALRRSASKICRGAHDALYEVAKGARDTLNALEGDILALRCAGSTGEFSDGADVAEVQEDLEWRMDNPGKIRGLTTGLPSFDKMTDGLCGGKSYVIGARPSVGKSALATNLIEHNIVRGRHVATFTLEMKRSEIQQRMIAGMSGVPMGGLREHPYSGKELGRITDSMARLAKLHWKIYDRSRLTVDQFRSACRRLHNEWGIDLVVLDYLQLMKGSEAMSKRDRRLEVGEISATCKEVAGELDVPVVSLSQLRRQGDTYFDKDKKTYVMQKPKLDDLRESGDIEQDADLVALLHRNQMDSATDAELILAKQRSGPTGVIELEFIPHLTRFKEPSYQP